MGHKTASVVMVQAFCARLPGGHANIHRLAWRWDPEHGKKRGADRRGPEEALPGKRADLHRASSLGRSTRPAKAMTQRLSDLQRGRAPGAFR